MQYEEASKLNAMVTKGLLDVHDKLGNPSDCSVNTGWVMMDNIMQIWKKFYPGEVEDWKKDVIVSLDTERTIAASVKEGGYFPMSYPTRLYKLIKTLLPDQKLNDDNFIKDITGRYPFLKVTNAKL